MTAALVAALLPGDDAFPPADRIALHEALAAHNRFSGPLAAIVARLPAGFASLNDAEAREAALRRIEAAAPGDFSRLIVGAYSLYYTHPSVAAVIERLTGKDARPPQPHGHDLPPFDPAMVAIPAARPPLYRPTPESGDA